MTSRVFPENYPTKLTSQIHPEDESKSDDIPTYEYLVHILEEVLTTICRNIPSEDEWKMNVAEVVRKISAQVLVDPAKGGDAADDRRQSFAVEQISDMNKTAQRRSRFSQKSSGVVITTSAEEMMERGKVSGVNDYFFLKTLGKVQSLLLFSVPLISQSHFFIL
jgi:hypothetical protein